MKYSRKYRADIDGMRALAVLLVVGFHAFPQVVKNGFIGVDIFFVISGFLITDIIISGLNSNSFSFIDFYSRRIRRIFPALLAVLISAIVFGYFVCFADEYKSLGLHVFSGAFFIANIVYWQDATQYFDEQLKLLLHLWSLGVEEQFYLVWPPLLALVAYKNKYLKKHLGLFIWGLLTASFAYNIMQYHGNHEADFFSPTTRFWELMSGALLAYYQQRPKAININLPPWITIILYNILSLVAIGLIIFALMKIRSWLYPGWYALLPIIASVMLLAIGQRAMINKYILANPVMVGIGLISYPLYLWHYPILIFLRLMNQESLPYQISIMAVVASFILAIITYWLIEKPMRFGKNKQIKTAGLLIGMIVVGLLGALLYQMNGLPNRLKDKNLIFNERQFSQFDSDDPQEKYACKKYLGTIAPALNNFCLMNDKGASRTLLLFGDSHAHEAYLGIKNYLKNKNINIVVFLPACVPPLFGIEAVQQTKKSKASCTTALSQMKDLLRAKNDITDILMIFRGTYLYGHAYLLPKNTPPDYLVMPEEFFTKYFQNTVTFIRGLGKDVYYLTDNPELRHEPRDCLRRPIILKKEPLQCDVTLSDMVAGQADYMRMVNRITGIKLIYSLPYFCPNGVCPLYNSEGQLMYRDKQHLSAFGSIWQANHILAPYLDKIAKQTKP
ncbi:MAG: acyltransferase family protein [Alphaproteobacteria bacterium]|nr:acyltransferase family protein [Alphaproteobacteria bacterium]